jgi:hypothetical protein
MALLFSRNAKLYVELLGSTADSPTVNTVWQVPVLDGFSFSQASESTEIVSSEAGSTPARGRLLFNTAVNPVEWSFSTYVRPFKTTGVGGGTGALDGNANDIHAVEEVLWAMLFGCNSFTSATAVFGGATGTPHTLSSTSTGSTFNLQSSNVANMPDRWNLYFSFEPTAGTADQVYKLTSAVVNSATIDFDIEGIATIQWSGFAKSISTSTTIPTKDIYEKITDTSTFIRNKLSTATLTSSVSGSSKTYAVNITGGSVTFENNVTYLTPEELGVVNQPFANIAGTRSISGNLTCYMKTDNLSSGTLYSDLTAATTTIRNSFDMAINIGGETAGSNRLVVDIPTAHLEIPNIGIEDLITLDVTFHAQPSSNTFSDTAEASIIYKVT